MARLKEQHKKIIVKELACFANTKDIQILLKETYGVEVTPSQVSFYNPENNSSTNLAKKWLHLFYDTRRRYVEEESKAPIFHRGYRLQQLQKNYDKAQKAGNIVLAMQILEQAAKETGRYYERGAIPFSPNDGSNFFQEINQAIINQRVFSN